MSDGRLDLAGGDRRPGPVARRVMRLGPSACMRRASCLMFSTMSTTSSRTPSMRGELVHDAVDLDGGDGGALQRRQQHAAQGVAERHAEAALERLGDHARLALRVGAGLDLRLLGADELVPVSFDHGRYPSDGIRRPRGGAGRRGEEEGFNLDAPALGRPAAVVRNGRHVADGGDGHAHRLQRAQRRLRGPNPDRRH